MTNDRKSIRDQVNDLVRGVQDNFNLLLTTPLLVDFFDGDHNAALMMNQVLYWTERTKDPDGWFYKTHHDWFEELRFTPYQIRRVVSGDERVENPKRNLSEVGLETRVRMAPNGRNATFYRLDLPQFMGMFVDWLERKFGRLMSGKPKQKNLKTRERQSEPKQESQITAAPKPATMPVRQELPEIKPSERVKWPWENGYRSDSTVSDAWGIAHNQLEIQFDRANFELYLRDVRLVDFEPRGCVFTLLVTSDHAAEMLRYRLYRNVRRVLSDAFGQEVEIVVVTRDMWQSPQRE